MGSVPGEHSPSEIDWWKAKIRFARLPPHESTPRPRRHRFSRQRFRGQVPPGRRQFFRAAAMGIGTQKTGRGFPLAGNAPREQGPRAGPHLHPHVPRPPRAARPGEQLLPALPGPGERRARPRQPARLRSQQGRTGGAARRSEHPPQPELFDPPAVFAALRAAALLRPGPGRNFVLDEPRRDGTVVSPRILDHRPQPQRRRLSTARQRVAVEDVLPAGRHGAQPSGTPSRAGLFYDHRPVVLGEQHRGERRVPRPVQTGEVRAVPDAAVPGARRADGAGHEPRAGATPSAPDWRRTAGGWSSRTRSRRRRPATGDICAVRWRNSPRSRGWIASGGRAG